MGSRINLNSLGIGLDERSLSGTDRAFIEMMMRSLEKAQTQKPKLESHPISEKPYAEVREAVRRKAMEDFDNILINSLKRLKGNEFVSTKYLTAGFLTALGEGAVGVYPQIVQTLESPFVELTKKAMGINGLEDVVDKVFQELSGRMHLTSDDEKYGEATKVKDQIKGMINRGVEQVRNIKERDEKYVAKIAEYAEKRKIAPSKVLKSKKLMLRVINESYGSLDEYERVFKPSLPNLDEAKLFLEVDYSKTIRDSIESKLSANGIKTLNSLNVDFDRITKGVQQYVKELATCFFTLGEETLKYREKEIAAYRKLEQKTLAPQ